MIVSLPLSTDVLWCQVANPTSHSSVTTYQHAKRRLNPGRLPAWLLRATLQCYPILAMAVAPLQRGRHLVLQPVYPKPRIRHSHESARGFLRGGGTAHRQGIACAPCRPQTLLLKVEEPSGSGPRRQVEWLTPSALPAPSRSGSQPRVRTRRRWPQTADRTQRSVLLRSNRPGELNRLVGFTENAQSRRPSIQGQATRPLPGMPAEATR